MAEKETLKKKRRVPIFVIVLLWLFALLAAAAVGLNAFVSYYLKPVSTAEDAVSVEYKIPTGKTVTEKLQ